jgi:serine/threonine protein phosphatase PrpC
MSRPLDFGAATRPYPGKMVNGDAFVIEQWDGSALVAVIDGLGHGQFAHRAAQAARQYVETHLDQPLKIIFRGVGRTCRATQGVVMALARIDWALGKLTFASVGNVEARILGSPQPVNFIVRRGVIGLNAPDPVVTEHRWEPTHVLVLHSDGLKTHWRWEDFAHLQDAAASVVAQQLLQRLARDDDDVTVVVVRGARDAWHKAG